MAATAAVGTAAVRGCSAPIFGKSTQQHEVLKHLVTRHVQDAALAELMHTSEMAPTSTERGVSHWEHAHIIAALDVLLAYQSDRRSCWVKVGSKPFGHRTSGYQKDPRTRFVEIYKRWLRQNAAASSIDEDDLRSMCGLCRDVLNHPTLFPSRNNQSFMNTLAEVYVHLQWQLREVLEKDRTCAELAQRVLSMSRNLLSDAIVYLLLAPTSLKETDKIPSLEVVALWQSLPDDMNPLPSRSDQVLKKTMEKEWKTHCGQMVAAIVSTPWCVRLFDGAGAQEEATAALADADVGARRSSSAVPELIAGVRAAFENKDFKGLAGILRKDESSAARESYLVALETVFDLAYLMGEALVQFHRISDGLGDYGMIRVAPWLHPFLEALVEKVHKLKKALEALDGTIERGLNLARARGQKIDSPAPTQKMTARANNAISRAITDRSSHSASLLKALEELRARSAPERLPHLAQGLGDACTQLQIMIASPEFRARIGDSFPDLPALMPEPNIGHISTATTPAAIEWDDEEIAIELDPAFEKKTRSSRGSRSASCSSVGGAASMDLVPRPPRAARLVCDDRAGASVRSRVPRGPRTLPDRLAMGLPSCEQAAAEFAAVKKPPLMPSKPQSSGDRSPCFGSRAGPEVCTATNPFTDDATSDVGGDNPFEAEDDAGNPFEDTNPFEHDDEPAQSSRAVVARHALPSGFALSPKPTALSLAMAKAASPGTPQRTRASSVATACSDSDTTVSARSGQTSEMSGVSSAVSSQLGSSRRNFSAPMRTMAEKLPAGARYMSASLRSSSPAGPQKLPAAILHGASGEMIAEVFRLTTSMVGLGWRRHDRRNIKLQNGFLYIYSKGSSKNVKTIVDIARDLEGCALVSGSILTLNLQRRSQSISGPAVVDDSKDKVYFFEFASRGDALAFNGEISNLMPSQGLRGRPS